MSVKMVVAAGSAAAAARGSGGGGGGDVQRTREFAWICVCVRVCGGGGGGKNTAVRLRLSLLRSSHPDRLWLGPWYAVAVLPCGRGCHATPLGSWSSRPLAWQESQRHHTAPRVPRTQSAPTSSRSRKALPWFRGAP
jgi:hypothetical protein